MSVRIRAVREKVTERTIHLRLPDSVLERLNLMAAYEGRDRTEMARKIIEEYFYGPAGIRIMLSEKEELDGSRDCRDAARAGR